MALVSMESLRCHEETDEVGADAPYVIVSSVDLGHYVTLDGTPIPESSATLYVATDVDARETHPVPFNAFWAPNRQPRDLSNPDRSIFLVSLMEWDNGSRQGLTIEVENGIKVALRDTGGIVDRQERAFRLMDRFSLILNTSRMRKDDERIGNVQELKFTAEDVRQAERGTPARRALRFHGDGGEYTVTFVVRR